MTALEAHLKLLAILPVRTHRWIPLAGHTQGRPSAERTLRLNKAILELAARGLSRKEIAQKLDIEAQTVGRHLRGDRKCLQR